MQVTKVEPVTKTKYKVFIDEQFAFVLYKGELSRYKIYENGNVSQEILDLIRTEVLMKRAKLRAMYLLNHMDRTERQLRNRLKRDLYTEDIIEIAIQYVKSFGYIGDYEYAKRYVESRQSSKSKMEIKMSLLQKGVSKELIEEVIEECYQEQDDVSAIKCILNKKKYKDEVATDVERKKMFEYLLRKGFSYEDIRQVIQVSFWNA